MKPAPGLGVEWKGAEKEAGKGAQDPAPFFPFSDNLHEGLLSHRNFLLVFVPFEEKKTSTNAKPDKEGCSAL